MVLFIFLGLEVPITSEGTAANSDSLPITPNYLAHPPIDYKVPVTVKNPPGKSISNGISEGNDHPSIPTHQPSYTSVPGPMHDYLAKQSKGNYVYPLCYLYLFKQISPNCYQIVMGTPCGVGGVLLLPSQGNVLIPDFLMVALL